MFIDPRRIPRYLMVSITCLLIMVSFVPSLPKVAAHSGVFLSAYTNTSPVIDGTIGAAGEWSDADTMAFGPFGPGDIYSGTLYMMNNASHLLIAVIISGDSDLTTDDLVFVDFDNDHGGETSREEGDDVLVCVGEDVFVDQFWDTSVSGTRYDTTDGGTSDGSAKGGQHSSYNHFEFEHPLNSSDNDHDFSLSVGDTVGFSLLLYVNGDEYYLHDFGLGLRGNPSTYADYIVDGSPALSAYAIKAPTIDGIKEVGEWECVDSADFVIKGTGSLNNQGTIYVMNDAVNLYILVKVEDDDAFEDCCEIYFDNDNGGGSTPATGDDGIDARENDFYDLHYYIGWHYDTIVDGEGDATRDESDTWYFEFSHPLDSADDSYDFSLSIGDTVGFCLYYIDLHSGGSDVGYWPSSSPDYYGDIIIAPPRFIGMLNFDDHHNRMGSLTAMEPTNTFYFPHFHRDSNWQTFYALVNPGSSSASIDVTYYASDGSTISTESFSLDPGHKTGKFPPTGSGWIKVVSDVPIVGMLNFDDYANRMGSMPGVTPSLRLYFPHFHRDSNWQTFYALVNPQTSSADIDVTYYGSDGSIISTESFSLDAGHKTGKFSASGTGFIQVISSVQIVGMLNFDDYANRMGSMPGVEPSTTLYFPHFHRDSNWQTFYAIVNLGCGTELIDVTYYASDGSIISTESISLDADHKVGKFPPSGTGWIKVESSVPIVGMLNFDDYSNRMGSMPGVTPESLIYFPHFDQGSSWQTYYAMVNFGTDCTITSTYYASDGSIVGSDSIGLPENNKAGRFPVSGNGWIELPS